MNFLLCIFSTGEMSKSSQHNIAIISSAVNGNDKLGIDTLVFSGKFDNKPRIAHWVDRYLNLWCSIRCFVPTFALEVSDTVSEVLFLQTVLGSSMSSAPTWTCIRRLLHKWWNCGITSTSTSGSSLSAKSFQSDGTRNSMGLKIVLYCAHCLLFSAYIRCTSVRRDRRQLRPAIYWRNSRSAARRSSPWIWQEFIRRARATAVSRAALRSTHHSGWPKRDTIDYQSSGSFACKLSVWRKIADRNSE